MLGYHPPPPQGSHYHLPLIPQGSPAADRPTRRPPGFGSAKGGAPPLPPTTPNKTVAHPLGSHIGWRQPPWVCGSKSPDIVKFGPGSLLVQCCSLVLASGGASLPCWLLCPLPTKIEYRLDQGPMTWDPPNSHLFGVNIVNTHCTHFLNANGTNVLIRKQILDLFLRINTN